MPSNWDVSHLGTKFPTVYLVLLSFIRAVMPLVFPSRPPLGGCMCRRSRGYHLLGLPLFLIKELTPFDHVRSQDRTVNTSLGRLKYYTDTAVSDALILFTFTLNK